MRNEIIQAVKAFIRQPYAWPGGYPLMVVMSDGECLCQACAKHNFRQIVESTKEKARYGWQAVGVDVNYENDELQCAHCGKTIESAYGENDK